MALNFIWISFFLIAFVVAVVKLVFFGDTEIFPDIIKATFDMARVGFENSLALTGVLTLWMGIMKIGEEGGIVKVLSRIIGPFFNKLFPGLGKNHPAYGPMIMNLAANMLGLDNAATPMGLQAMKEMQKSNKEKDTASNAQIMFLVLNTSGLTVIPISVMAYRAVKGAADPSDIFMPILLATFFSTFVGLVSVSIVQRINIFNRVIISYLGVLTAIIIGLVVWLSALSKEDITIFSKVASNLILFTTIVVFILLGVVKRVNVYEAFIEGAKSGFSIAIRIIPYLVAILLAVGVFRASGALSYITDGLGAMFGWMGVNTDFVDALPTAFMKPLSGSGARGMMIEVMDTYGADSFVGRVASTVQGATDTTFYIITIYFGSVGIKRVRHAIGCGLLADFAGIVASILLAYLFFG